MIQAGKDKLIKQGRELQELKKEFIAAEVAAMESQAEVEAAVEATRKRLEACQIDLVRGSFLQAVASWLCFASLPHVVCPLSYFRPSSRSFTDQRCSRRTSASVRVNVSCFYNTLRRGWSTFAAPLPHKSAPFFGVCIRKISAFILTCKDGKPGDGAKTSVRQRQSSEPSAAC